MKNFISYLMVTVVLLIGFFFTYLAAYPRNAIDVYSLEVVQVENGKNLTYEVDYCKYVKHSAVISRIILGNTNGTSYAIQLPRTGSKVDEGCADRRVTIEIPEIPEGTYTLKVMLDYNFNFLNQQTVERTSQEFEIR